MFQVLRVALPGRLLVKARVSSTMYVSGDHLSPASGIITHSSHSAANLTNMSSVSSSLSKLSDSVLPNNNTGGSNTGPQPIPFPESFLPRGTSGPNGSIIDFQTEWLEIAFAPNALTDPNSGLTNNAPSNKTTVISDHTSELRSTVLQNTSITDKTGPQDGDSVHRKSCICDLDDATVGDRAEWTHCVYDATYHPLCAFTMELQWLVASGSRLNELVPPVVKLSAILEKPVPQKRWTYVHCSGGMFVMIPIYRTADVAASTTIHTRSAVRTSSSSDATIRSEDAMLADFRAFMSAEDDRLTTALAGFLATWAKRTNE
ncbi:unnamed protein product [Echinostoma caproni]|uniref:DEPDC5_CTD domain-containing protein n=1 Tax=Echinostoma caproni TaxID=27848 RepID=A0A183ADV8_9TREM|nr:unnamed protein product [Echinostoma caproni]